jgi:hypothetical protein
VIIEIFKTIPTTFLSRNAHYFLKLLLLLLNKTKELKTVPTLLLQILTFLNLFIKTFPSLIANYINNNENFIVLAMFIEEIKNITMLKTLLSIEINNNNNKKNNSENKKNNNNNNKNSQNDSNILLFESNSNNNNNENNNQHDDEDKKLIEKQKKSLKYSSLQQSNNSLNSKITLQIFETIEFLLLYCKSLLSLFVRDVIEYTISKALLCLTKGLFFNFIIINIL